MRDLVRTGDRGLDGVVLPNAQAYMYAVAEQINY